jgi:cytochrome oxidase assembly protein ShyY1
MNTTTITNEANGVITSVTAMHHHYFHYSALTAVIVIIVFALVTWALRKLFWNKDSN